MSKLSYDIPERFLPAYRRIQRLEQDGRYLAAFIFGSVARGEATEYSDLDVKVITKEDNPCTNINHPIIGGVKLDLTFLSLDQLNTKMRPAMEQREQKFVATCDVHTKFQFWSAIIDHILTLVGGRQPIAENNCDCAVCQRDLSMLLSDN